jgi:HAD superfamily hydrolase (TIGR01549 family)
MSTTFEAVVFDLFNTIVRWSPDRLPRFDHGGRSVPSTLPLLLPRLARVLGEDFDREAYVSAYFEVLREIEEERALRSVEITCRRRFERALHRFGLSPGGGFDGLAEDLTRTHMAAVRAVTSAPAEWTGAVRAVASKHRVGLLSNFDDSRTGHEIVGDTGLRELFEVVVISADLGIRKPHPEIFRHVLDALGLEAARVLYVGDTPHDDVRGAKSAGMPVAWLRSGEKPLPGDVPDPDLVLADLSELPAALGLVE